MATVPPLVAHCVADVGTPPRSPRASESEDEVEADAVAESCMCWTGHHTTTRELRPLGLRVAVVAPGAGTGFNSSVYGYLKKVENYQVDVIGQARSRYDHYPMSWGPPEGGPPPCLETWGASLVGRLQGAACLVVGSRGGQVVLPALWRALGPAVPPTVCINGGCSMDLPTGGQGSWPESAYTFLILGGKDYFRGPLSPEEYVANAKKNVPARNGTTAILYINEMEHMPAPHLLQPILVSMVSGMISWKNMGKAPLADFHTMCQQLHQGGWTGRFLFTGAPGVWEDMSLSSTTQLGRRTPAGQPAAFSQGPGGRPGILAGHSNPLSNFGKLGQPPPLSDPTRLGPQWRPMLAPTNQAPPRFQGTTLVHPGASPKRPMSPMPYPAQSPVHGFASPNVGRMAPGGYAMEPVARLF